MQTNTGTSYFVKKTGMKKQNDKKTKEQNKLVSLQKTKSRFSASNRSGSFLSLWCGSGLESDLSVWCGSESYFSLSPDPAPHQSDEICHHWHTDPPRIRIPLLILMRIRIRLFTLIRIRIQFPKMMRICNRNRIRETDAIKLIIW